MQQIVSPFTCPLATEPRKTIKAATSSGLVSRIEARASLVRTICDEVHQLLDQPGLSREHLGWDGWHPHPLMCDLQALKGYIQREERNVFFDIDTCKDIDIIPRKL